MIILRVGCGIKLLACHISGFDVTGGEVGVEFRIEGGRVCKRSYLETER